MKISPNGSWLNETPEGHVFDPSLANAIAAFCKAKQLKTITDLGCGPGDYIRVLKKNQLLATGYDGNPYTLELTDGHGAYFELHIPIEKTIKADLVLSLEVGEHIPEQYESVFLDNVVHCARTWIVLSWAIPGQGGDGHVNCRENNYIIAEMDKRGYGIVRIETENLRKQSTSPWFKNTLMVFIGLPVSN